MCLRTTEHLYTRIRRQKKQHDLTWLALYPTDVEEQEEGNDWLFIVIEDIITAHNDMVELPKQLASQPFVRLLPQQQSTAYPREMTTANCIIPQFRGWVAVVL